ncbi:hypothetical protein D3C81_1315360 [compost metagenome]
MNSNNPIKPLEIITGKNCLAYIFLIFSLIKNELPNNKHEIVISDNIFKKTMAQLNCNPPLLAIIIDIVTKTINVVFVMCSDFLILKALNSISRDMVMTNHTATTVKNILKLSKEGITAMIGPNKAAMGLYFSTI